MEPKVRADAIQINELTFIPPKMSLIEIYNQN